MQTNSTLMAISTVCVLLHGAAYAQAVPQAKPAALASEPASHAAYVMPQDDIGAFLGQFLMQDGTTLTIARRHRRLFAEVAGGSVVELIPTARDAFVSADGKVILQFQQAGNGNVYGVAMRRPGRAG